MSKLSKDAFAIMAMCSSPLSDTIQAKSDGCAPLEIFHSK